MKKLFWHFPWNTDRHELLLVPNVFIIYVHCHSAIKQGT